MGPAVAAAPRPPALTSPRRAVGGLPVPGERSARPPSRDAMKPRATEPSSFAGTGAAARTASWRCRSAAQAAGPRSSGAAPPRRPALGPSLDGLDVVRWVQANPAIVQAPLAPALFVLVLYLGQLVPCKTKRGVLLAGGDTLTSGWSPQAHPHQLSGVRGGAGPRGAAGAERRRQPVPAVLAQPPREGGCGVRGVF